ncbi:3-phosphoshikimate 1-carboxyvinyltransferase [uncultured Duncaniella sp.]|uniref:3-phosphoshikimate 1-carboxyvinyltransferase n=1 Tax=uncultured Duncaniella sp. TaxID=2768039 RepID=UPI0025D5CA8A|nr:3-phosphoshikimate 1-carboxyvinyltransferase [uncultured Duncaniella sp.]
MDYRILPPEGFLEARLSLPLSKSMSNRALIINALTPGARPLEEVAVCDDTDAMRNALASQEAKEINIGAAGTTMRFLTAYFAAKEGSDLLLDGSERMRHRPIKVLVEALRTLGADIEYAGEEGFPPLRIRGRRLAGGELKLDSSVSSQYISALLMIAPTMKEGLKLTFLGETVSRPYILMTLKMMEDAGIESDYFDDVVTIKPQTYKPFDFKIEGDWSAAAAWYEIDAISSGAVTIDNLARESCQGDRKLADIFERLGVTTEWEGEDGGSDLIPSPDQDARLKVDFSDTPDLAQYVIVTCVMLGIPFRFTGLSTLAIKETDRVSALTAELAKIGVMLQPESRDVVAWEGQRRPIDALPVFDTYDDHRMAMCLAPISIFLPGIIIKDVEVVAKSYPEFWDEMRNAGFILLDGDAPLPDPE